MRRKTIVGFAVGLAAVAAALAAALPAGARTAGTPTYTLSTATAEINSGDLNQGWWSTGSGHSASNSNYLVGQNESGNHTRNFFTFALGGIPNPCTPSSAVLHVPEAGGGNQAIFSTGPASLVYSLYDVTTNPVTLTSSGAANAAIFSDLGSGTLYGSYALSTAVSGSTFNLALNGNALAAIGFAKKNGIPYFSIGGAIVPDPVANFNFLYGFSGDPVTMTLTFPKICRVYP